MCKTILNIILSCVLLLSNSLSSVFLGVENKSSKNVTVKCQFFIQPKNVGRQRCVDGEIKVGKGKFMAWQEEEQDEEEKNGDAFLVFFTLNDDKYEISALGRFWYLTVETHPIYLHKLKGTIVKYHESYNEERDKKEAEIAKSIVAQRVRTFSQGTSSSSSRDVLQRGGDPYLNRDPNRLTRFYTGTLKRILDK